MPEPFSFSLFRLWLVLLWRFVTLRTIDTTNSIEIYRGDVRKEKAKCEVKARVVQWRQWLVSTLLKLEIYKLWKDLEQSYLLPHVLHQFLPKWSIWVLTLHLLFLKLWAHVSFSFSFPFHVLKQRHLFQTDWKCHGTWVQHLSPSLPK